MCPCGCAQGYKPWTFWLAYHTRTIGSQIRGIVLTNILLAAAISVILLPASLLVTRWMLRPLETLTQAADQLKGGNLQVSLPPATGDEIGRLVNAFDAMARSITVRDAEIHEKVRALREARNELEIRVQERTAELQQANQELTREITDRERAEEATMRENAKLAAMISGMEEGVIFADGDNAVIEVNNYFCRFIGKKRHELLGKKLDDAPLGQARELILDRIARFRCLSDQKALVMQRPFKEAEVIMRIQPIYRDRHYDGVVLNFVNVTELVRAAGPPRRPAGPRASSWPT